MPKISGESLNAHREHLRESVFQAFVDIVAERGFDGVTMARLAERAGVGRTAIYHHFKDRDAVVVAFATQETNRYLENLAGVLADADSPSERMRRYLRHHLAEGEQFHLGLGPQVYGLLSPASLQEIREHVVAVEQVLRGIVEDGIAAGEFTVADVDAVLRLIHVCLGVRSLPPEVAVDFVMGGLGVHAS